jgi:hypothetical protein
MCELLDVQVFPCPRVQSLCLSEHKSNTWNITIVCRFSDALFVFDGSDYDTCKQKIMEVKQLNAEGWRDWVKSNYHKLLRHCRRFMCKPDIMKTRLDWLYGVFADLRDATTNLPLFSRTTKKRWNSLMKHVENGCLSDPDPLDINLYFVSGKTRDGLLIYGCYRGTCDIEGYHQKLKGVLDGWHNSPEVIGICVSLE